MLCDYATAGRLLHALEECGHARLLEGRNVLVPVLVRVDPRLLRDPRGHKRTRRHNLRYCRSLQKIILCGFQGPESDRPTQFDAIRKMATTTKPQTAEKKQEIHVFEFSIFSENRKAGAKLKHISRQHLRNNAITG